MSSNPGATPQTLAGFDPFSAGETRLVEAARAGTIAKLGDDCPLLPTDANLVRADLLRFLAIGGGDALPLHAHGVHVEGAWIEGVLDFAAASVERPLQIWNSRIERFDAERSSFAFLHLGGSRLENGFFGDELRCRTSVYLRNGFSVSGGVRLAGAVIEGSLDCSGGTFDNGSEPALFCETARISGSVFLNDGFVAKGGVTLAGASIGGLLDCADGRFSSRGYFALACDGLSVGRTLFLNKGCKVLGGVSLKRAIVRHDVDCRGGRFLNREHHAVVGDGCEISGSLFLNQGFRARGGVRFVGAKIAGNLDCSGGTFRKAGGEALCCRRAEIGGALFLNDGFRARGSVLFTGASVTDKVDCSKGGFNAPNGCALALDHAKARLLRFCKVAELAGGVDLRAAHVSTLEDDAKSWAGSRGNLRLDGFGYDRFGGSAATDARTRIKDWLEIQHPDDLKSEFRPQPWEQLISVLKSMGHPDDARTVAVEQRTALRNAGRVRGLGWLLHWLHGLSVGYGYRPARLLYATTGVWFVCTCAYWMAEEPAFLGLRAPLIGPSGYEEDCIRSAKPPPHECRLARLRYDDFEPAIYSLDVLLPIVDLGHEDEWKPVLRDREGRLPHSGLLRGLYWFEIAWGWIAGLLVASLVGAALRKD